MIDWIMTCVSTTSYSVSINGNVHGYFKGGRGLRQADPLSPYLFTLVMEVLNLMIKRKISETGSFSYHRNCEEQEITHLCFADDLLIFSHGDSESVRVIKDSLDEFSSVSGLYPSPAKSEAFYCSIGQFTKSAIHSIIQFPDGSLPVRYLGVPLITTRLYRNDCKGLVDKVKARLNDWRNKSLSFAGRLQLIISVLSSMQIYWASIFILPISITKEIEKLMRGFLWCHGELKRGKAKVSWKTVCLPKTQGGLGVKSLADWNLALMASHSWRILTNKDSLWVKWIHSYRLKDRNFWDAPIRSDVGWGWRKILGIRDKIRDFIVSQIGDGSATSAWFDNWHPVGPLCRHITPRNILNANLSLDARVRDIICNGSWICPQMRDDSNHLLSNHPPPVLSTSVPDRLLWRKRDGSLTHFSVHDVWLSIRPNEPDVDWYHMV